MAGADALAGVAVEVFVKGDGVAPVRIGLEFLHVAEDRALSVGGAQEDADEAAGDFGGDFPKVHHLARAGRAFYFEVVAVVVMELLERFDNQVVKRKPDWAAPVRVAAEESGS